MSVHIEAEEWSITAGLIGLVRVLGEERVKIAANGLSLNAQALENLAEKYIRTLISTFSVVERDVKRMKWYVQQIQRQPDKCKQYVTEIRKLMNDQLKKVVKYFQDTEECRQLQQTVESLKHVKDDADLPVIEQAVRTYEKAASQPFINEKLTLNYVKAVILNPFFGQTSILQPTFNAKNTEEHIQQIAKDFVNPAIFELQFFECLQSADDAEQIRTFLTEYQDDYKPFKEWLRKVKKCKSLDEVKKYFENEVFPCSFIDGLLATQSYEEMVFSPLALSRSKAVNFNWDFGQKQPVPISAVARLIMLMAPLGMAFYTRKVGSAQSSETLRFAGLILSQQSFSSLIGLNKRYRDLRSEGTTFGEAVAGVLQEAQDKAKRLKHAYLFLEVHSDYQSKKTLLDYYHMPAYLVDYLAQYGNALTLLHHRELRDDFLRMVLKGIDPKQVIFDYLRAAVEDAYHGIGAYHAVRERHRILNAKGGVNEMGSHDKLIKFIYYRGVELREHIVNERNTQEESGTYRASGRKKLEGIAYRLINSTKSGNKQAFMDTLFRLYLGTGLDVPSVFVDSFKEEGLDFETIASAFIAGLLSKETIKKEEVMNHG